VVDEVEVVNKLENPDIEVGVVDVGKSTEGSSWLNFFWWWSEKVVKGG
jgi:hypothetical protein